MKVAWDFAISVNYLIITIRFKCMQPERHCKFNKGMDQDYSVFITGKKPRSVELTSRHEKE